MWVRNSTVAERNWVGPNYLLKILVSASLGIDCFQTKNGSQILGRHFYITQQSSIFQQYRLSLQTNVSKADKVNQKRQLHAIASATYLAELI
ncbi:hypothetical protein [Vibrio misgurnus]|uniref:hypothetical protein n=1 Tax=Vibrio misgurnus TaxID=2993714 RepID=UPI0023FA32AB|nr:hypothetical protein [Vibrio sp. VCS]